MVENKTYSYNIRICFRDVVIKCYQNSRYNLITVIKFCWLSLCFFYRLFYWNCTDAGNGVTLVCDVDLKLLTLVNLSEGNRFLTRRDIFKWHETDVLPLFPDTNSHIFRKLKILKLSNTKISYMIFLKKRVQIKDNLRFKKNCFFDIKKCVFVLKT